MGRTKGTYTLTSNIEPKVGAPLDARTIVKLLADLTASNTFEYPYKGMKVFVEENNKSYTLVGSDPTVSTNWIEDNSGGHTIKNPAGTAMTQRSNLQFVDLTVSDDSTNDVTKVENIHVIQSESELDNLPDGLYMLNEDEGTVIDSDLVGYDNTDSGLEAGNVQDAIDEVVDALDNKIDISAKGVANGIAELDSTGKVPSSQLPSFVDDVLEYSSFSAFPATGETGKIYVALDTNKTYRWGGTEYVEISESLALGETSSTAYRGDRGKTAYDHSQLTSGNPHNVTKSEVGLGNVDNTSDSTKKTNFTGSIASGNTGFVTGGDAYTALGGKADKVSSATNGNLAGLNGSGNLTDSGWNGAKDTTSISGNPISISGLKANQLAINPIITFEPIQDLHGQSKPYPAGGGKNKLNLVTKASTQSQQVTYEYKADNTLVASGTSTGNADLACDCASDIKLKANTTYTISFSGSALTWTAMYLYFYNPSAGAYTSPVGCDSTTKKATYTTPNTDMTFTKILLRVPSTKSCNINARIQIEEGNTATAYAPYENICPISGYDKIEVLSCGKNIWDGETKEGYYSDTGAFVSHPNYYCSSNPVPVKGGGYSYISVPLYRCYYDKAFNFISKDNSGNAVVQIPSNAAYLHFYHQKASWTSPSTTMVSDSNEAVNFEPYDKTTDLSESLGQTVYGGSLDVRTGVLTVTHGVVDLGTKDWSYHASTSSTDTNRFSISTGAGYLGDAKVPNASNLPNAVCDIYQPSTNTQNVNGGNTRTGYISITTGGNLVITDTRFTSPSDLKTALNGIKFSYELKDENKFTIQLTPHEISLLKDYAYVSTNGTNIALDYHNGELASLADVSQLGETVNELGEYLKARKISGTGYSIYQIGELLIVYLSGFTGNALPITLPFGGMGGLATFYDTTSKKYLYASIESNGEVSFRNESATVISTYNVYGSCVVAGFVIL